ncbi:MAG: AAA family ATPase [Chloroflexi bacterium]|nr:AAA family ATPase [Chloroflexota bacterium]
MLTKIIRIRNVGLLADATVNGVVELSRVTLIYGENGRGKSTLASIMRSCSLGDAQRIMAHKTIDSAGPPEVNLLVNDGKANSNAEFADGAWTGTRPDIVVFDSEFCDDNVYSGFEVRTDQKQSLLSFALGEQTVQLKHKLDQITKEIDDQTKSRSQAESALKIAATPFTVAQYAVSKKPADSKNQMALLEGRREAVRNAADLSNRRDPAVLLLLELPLEKAFGLLRKTSADVEKAAEKIVRDHLRSHKHASLEEWISNGQKYATAETCPFCGTSLKGIELIRAYQKFFNVAYQQLKAEVSAIAFQLEETLAEANFQILLVTADTNTALVDAWKTQLGLTPPVLPKDQVLESAETLRTQLARMASRKKEAFLEVVGSEEEYRTAERNLAAFNQRISAYNSSLAGLLEKITAYKKKLANESLASLQQEIEQLKALERLDNPNVSAALAKYNAAGSEKLRLEAEKLKAREQIDTQMQTTLTQYQSSINVLLKSFGAQFSIEQLKPTYVGSGEPRTDYGLNVRLKSVRLGARADKLVRPSFANTLSEGDKRTLAFSFFMARILADNNLAKRIIVLDDPVASLDRSRRLESVRQIAALSERCRQLIVLSHDPYFVRDLKEQIGLIKPPMPTAAMWMIARGTAEYSVFADCPIDEICESDYYRNYRLVDEYVTSGALDERTVATALRPLLEGYYHRKFPRLIPRNLTLGQIIGFFERAPAAIPLPHSASVIKELKEVNEYAGKFHHDTKLQADTIPIVDAELTGFAKRVLNLIYGS